MNDVRTSLLCLFFMALSVPPVPDLCAQWMAACLFVLGSKEAESILMGSEHLLHKVTPTGLARADPAAYKVRLLTGNQVISDLLSSPLSSGVGRILITISETELPGCNSFSLLLIQEVGCKSFFPGIDDCNLFFWGFHHGLGRRQSGRRSPPDALSQQIASGLAMLQRLPVKYCIDFRGFFVPCNPRPQVGWARKMGRKV